MVTFKRKKVTKYRGSKTHGCGSMKKRRGAGNRGGRGNAGSGKRADQKKPSYWNETDYFGRHGFVKKGLLKKTIYINLQTIEENADEMVSENLISQEKDTYVIDGEKTGFTKVLGSGRLTKKLRITAEEFSENAKKKIAAAGGEAIVKKQ